MLDIGWTELLVIGVVALIVVGPKDLPGMFRALGQFTAKMRRMARDFQRAMDDAADDSDIKETASSLKTMTSPKNLGLNTLKDAADKFDNWEPPKGMKPKGDKSSTDAASKPNGENTAKMREEQAKSKERAAEMKAARLARAAERDAAAAEPAAYSPRTKPGSPVGRAVRPKNMPKKKPGRGRA